MSYHFSMGAINKSTNNYEQPKIAIKSNKYKCPDCEKDVIFRNGKIKQPHFAHYKSDNPCYYYDKPNETQIHKDAKLLLKSLLDNKRIINFYRKCYHCYEEGTDSDDSFINYCNEEIEYFLNIKTDDYNGSQSYIEYKFNYNDSRKSADVALVKNENVLYIFEICYKNKTREENRPEPWFEINAENLINNINSGKIINEYGEINIECIRDYKCSYCKEREKERIENNKRYEYWVKKEFEKKKQQQKEENKIKNELWNMSKEDERTIQIQKRIEFEKEKQRIEREKLQKQIEEEREKERIKQKEKMEREQENMRKFLEKEKRCSICNINYCKCNNPKFIKNEYHRTLCNTCNKYKFMCVRITDFFKK